MTAAELTVVSITIIIVGFFLGLIIETLLPRSRQRFRR
jgi:hypothetical protein